MDTTWMAEGKCRELPPETFFPSDGVGVEVARRICADCPVKAPCLEYALYNRIEHGVWGGASERERRRIQGTLAVDFRLHEGDAVDTRAMAANIDRYCTGGVDDSMFSYQACVSSLVWFIKGPA